MWKSFFRVVLVFDNSTFRSVFAVRLQEKTIKYLKYLHIEYHALTCLWTPLLPSWSRHVRSPVLDIMRLVTESVLIYPFSTEVDISSFYLPLQCETSLLSSNEIIPVVIRRYTARSTPKRGCICAGGSVRMSKSSDWTWLIFYFVFFFLGGWGEYVKEGCHIYSKLYSASRGTLSVCSVFVSYI